jgi:hypothetical protein
VHALKANIIDAFSVRGRDWETDKLARIQISLSLTPLLHTMSSDGPEALQHPLQADVACCDPKIV